MKITRVASVVAAVALLAPPVLAQTPPATQPVEPPPSGPTPPPGDAPPPQTTPMTSSAPGDQHKLKMGETEVEEEGEPEVQWGIGARTRYITTPKWLIELFVAHATPMTSFSVA